MSASFVMECVAKKLLCQHESNQFVVSELYYFRTSRAGMSILDLVQHLKNFLLSRLGQDQLNSSEKFRLLPSPILA